VATTGDFSSLEVLQLCNKEKIATENTNTLVETELILLLCKPLPLYVSEKEFSTKKIKSRFIYSTNIRK